MDCASVLTEADKLLEGVRGGYAICFPVINEQIQQSSCINQIDTVYDVTS